MVTGKEVNLAAETKNLVEGAENTVPKPTEQMVTGKEVNLAGAENTEPKPTEQMVTGKEVNLAGAENTVPKPTEQMASGKEVNLAGAENTEPKPTEQMVTGKEVNLAETKNLVEGAENTVPKPTEQMASGKEVNLAGAENTVPKPTEQMASGKEVNLAGAENTVPKPTEQMASGKEVNLAGAENTVPKPTEQMAAGKEVNLAETKNLIEGAENTVPKPTKQMAAGKEVNLADWHQVKGFKVPSENIILDIKTVHPAIRISKGKRAIYVKEKDTENPSMRMHLHVFCVESFSSGQHYWEVRVKEQKVQKLSWYVGVARENVKRRSIVPLTPQNGFWILSYDKEKGFHVNTDPQTPITVAEITIVGVFLDCDRHTLSFYNVDTESLLYTFTDVTTSNYFPVFSPGQRDKTPMRILE
ncbi:butyrophilin subfamily 1 member A1 isoform X3 [Coregonus clupeaformis]|uniref:butyrophilin subfamily 1 member A1 isoform X3 n=1 Tax=Coregonus clupeaformis TaxID=59861 RepID=UPI001E1C8A2B|nr:butyrophilin subfamily 1 member A1 isoform X3 [Coregonus clupeaformis]